MYLVRRVRVILHFAGVFAMHIRCLKNLRFGLLCLVATTALMSCAESTQPGNYHAANLRVIQTVESFTALLSEQERETLFYAKDDPLLQTGWSHKPVNYDARNGLLLGDLNQEQYTAALQVIRVALGEVGYQQFSAVTEADQYLEDAARIPNYTLGQRKYYLAIFGVPTKNRPWVLQISGHNYTQHIVFGADVIAASPMFIGSLPGTFERNGHTVVPMQGKVEAMQMLLGSLSPEQLAMARFRSSYSELMAGSHQDTDFSNGAGEGLLARHLTTPQKALLLTAIMQWVDDVNADFSYLLRQRYQAQSDTLRIGWAGSPDLRKEYAYMRIQGSSLWIELSAKTHDDVPGIYYQSVYRDKAHDYGRK